jgi:hypothetical protein
MVNGLPPAPASPPAPLLKERGERQGGGVLLPPLGGGLGWGWENTAFLQII